jgi:hypothetical protein
MLDAITLYIRMYTNTDFNAILPVVPGSATLISCPSTTARHVTLSGMYVAARKRAHCGHTNDALITMVLVRLKHVV